MTEIIVKKPDKGHKFNKTNKDEYRKLLREYNKSIIKHDFVNQKKFAVPLKLIIEKGLDHFKYNLCELNKNEEVRIRCEAVAK